MPTSLCVRRRRHYRACQKLVEVLESAAMAAQEFIDMDPAAVMPDGQVNWYHIQRIADGILFSLELLSVIDSECPPECWSRTTLRELDAREENRKVA